jgi:hypothetical protein
MEMIAKAKAIEQFFISQNREVVENLNVLLRNSTGVQIAEWSKPEERLDASDAGVFT